MTFDAAGNQIPAPVGTNLGGTAPNPVPSSSIPWKQLLLVSEKTVVTAVASFLGSVAVFTGGAWDAKHLAAAGVAAATQAAYQLSGAINSLTKNAGS